MVTSAGQVSYRRLDGSSVVMVTRRGRDRPTASLDVDTAHFPHDLRPNG
jgi:hypothetical protein